jgi:hypothetical protein
MLTLKSTVLCCSLACAASISTANADVTYTYTGNVFTFFNSVNVDYTATDSISGSFTLSMALPANQSLTSVAITSFSFTDGVQTINSPPTTIEVGTDSSGNINAWSITLENSSCLISGACLIESSNDPSNPSSATDLGAFILPDMSQEEAFNIGDAGIWSSSASAVPGPTIGAGLPGLIVAGGGVLAWRRNKRRAQAAA